MLTLNLSFCSKITDVSGLGGVHTLNLSGYISITYLSELVYVNNLKLYETMCRNTKRLVFDQAAFTKLYHELLVLQRSYILTNLCLNL